MELFESLELTDDKKVALEEAFEKAVLAKSVELMDEHVETKVAEAKAVLEEEYQEKIENLEDTLDGYMTSVVEEFIAEEANKYEAQIQDEKSTKLLEMFDAMLKVAGIEMTDIHEARLQRDIELDESSLENQVKRLEKRLAEKEDALNESRKEASKYLKAGIINEMKAGLTLVEAEKFEKLADMVTFSKDEAYVNALDTIKESIIDGRSEELKESEGDIVLPAGTFKEEKVSVKSATDFSKYV